ncbi:autophagy protein 5-like [Lytechinus variegatus]|uniref:autophagy protein 5-like n=1 Tax=Lytechinus variegatus TaxID=7654 RepID=UPI001BB13496|nr:autophagy protein 5-like [Lytechinus variegatus]
MADDREILREIWEGRIPVTFVLAEDESSTENPEPCVLMVSRLTYITLIAEKIEKHFKKFTAIDEQDEVWFESNGQALKWHYPVGVLFDLHMHDKPLPWRITVHFKNFPEDEILHCKSKEVIEALYMSSVKEADVLKHRGQVMNNLQQKDHKQLWTGLQSDKFDQFWTTNRRLMERLNNDPFKYIPFRIYQSDKLHVQRLFKPVNDEGEPRTLRALLKETMPNIFADPDTKDHKVLIHGIETPRDTPVQWLSEHLSYPDNFLHMCVLPAQPSNEL